MKKGHGGACVPLPGDGKKLGSTYLPLPSSQVAFNSPGFHKVDLMAFVNRWTTDGHLSAIMKHATGPHANEVLEREAKEHKLTFLLG